MASWTVAHPSATRHPRSVRAKIHDPTGPRWTRLVLPALGMMGVLAGFFWWYADRTPLGPDFYMGMALLLAGPVILGRHAPRNAELVVHPGRIDVRRAGLLTQTIHAKDIGGASASASPGGIMLALERYGRNAPTLLELPSDADGKAVRDALGIGHHGVGTLSWPIASRLVDRVSIATRSAAAVSALVLGVCAFLGINGEPASTVSAYCLFFFPIVMFLALLRGRETNAHARIWLTPEDVRVQNGKGEWERIPYANIESAEVNSGWLVIERRDESPFFAAAREVKHTRWGMSHIEIAHVLAQIDAAARRARGEAQPEPGIGAAAPLARQDGERARAWLERLEATARQVKDGPSYRGATIAEAELWAALENHDADPDVRAASARVLSRVAPASALARIDAVVATVRDEGAKRRIRVALDPDLERATQELEEMEDFTPLVARR